MGKLHHAFTATGSVDLGALSLVPGTIPNRIVTFNSNSEHEIRIGHRSGVMDIKLKIIYKNQ